jgi:serine/threonine protein kinase
MDALVAERLTASPRIYDIYGQCGLGILSEFFPHGDMEHVIVPGDGYMEAHKLHDGYEVKPQNNLTGIEKLEISTQMAEAVADLHGNSGGVIVHQDIQLAQYLWTADKSMVKLNDFNRAEYMLFDEKNQEYCRYHEGPGNGNVCLQIVCFVSMHVIAHSSLIIWCTWSTSGDHRKSILTNLSRSR